MDFEQNERLEEWFLVVGDWFRATRKIWFYALGFVVLLAIPAYFFLSFTFSNILVSSIRTLHVNYTETEKTPLDVTEKKVFNLSDGTYTGFVRVKNPNFDWGLPKLDYQATFKSAGGATVMTQGGSTFILPSTEKIIVFPRFSSAVAPTSVDITFSPSVFIRPPSVPSLTLEIQRKDISVTSDQTLVNAVIVNRTPFKISRVDLPVLLFDRNNIVIGAGYTNINDLDSAESRSFQYTWFSRINNVARIEIVPEVNVYNRSIFLLNNGQNPFDDRDEETR